MTKNHHDMIDPNYDNIVRETCEKIAPLWPLKNFVAVNPYLGFSDHDFHEVAKMFAERSDIRMTLPLNFYLGEYEKGVISTKNIAQALAENGHFKNVEEFIAEVKSAAVKKSDVPKIETVIDVFGVHTDLPIGEIMVDSLSAWAASYFDEYQAIWNAPADQSPYNAWLQEAKVDRLPEIRGIKKFRKTIDLMPEKKEEVISLVTKELGLKAEHLESYLHTLLLKISGWASYISGIDWNNKLYSSASNNLSDLLAILLSWEYVTFRAFEASDARKKWLDSTDKFLRKNTVNEDDILFRELIMQDAYDLAHENSLIRKFRENKKAKVKSVNPKAQAIFCIDVRSEIIRRNIESHDPEIETIGFAGFFGFPINYKPIGFTEGRNQCPALIPSGPVVLESITNDSELKRQTLQKKIKDQYARTIKYFKTGAISAYSYVSPLGIFYLPGMLKRTFGKKSKPEINGRLHQTEPLDLSHVTLEQKIDMAASSLTNMGLREKLSPIVMLVGHGSTSINNPHASGLDCGACGGHSGKMNAITGAQVFNDPQVRKGLESKGISIPQETTFVAGVHDTTSDEISIYYTEEITSEQMEVLRDISNTFENASMASRTERALRFQNIDGAVQSDLPSRGSDWSQIRPEWGLAGCSSFVVGSRKHTQSIPMNGKSFLHNYDHKNDSDLKILESIMTAPMVVTSWINLQYYASVTDNKNFGAGNKTLHNVTSGIGVLEGGGGDLRTGLPIQSIHDGKEYQHLPQRLCVFIEAPTENINSILQKHPNIQALFDHKWITLFNLGSDGTVQNKYLSGQNWDSVEKTEKIKEKAYPLV